MALPRPPASRWRAVAKDVVMPVLGMNQEFGTVVKWLVAEGQAVQDGQPLLEVETDKAIVEVPAMGTGVLARVSAAEGDEVPTGSVIAVLLGEDEVEGARAPERMARPREADTPKAPPASSSPSPPPVAATPAPEFSDADRQRASAVAHAAPRARANGLPLASPKAKRLAKELALDLRSVAGSGPGGAIRATDLAALLRHGAARPAFPASDRAAWLRKTVDGSALREVVARANAYLARQARPTAVTSCDVLARLALASLAACGAPAPGALTLVRGAPDGSLEERSLGPTAGRTLVAIAQAGSAGGEGATVPADLQVIDVSESPYESELPPLPADCPLRVAVTSAGGGADDHVTLTVEHREGLAAEPAELLMRLAALIEDPVSALLHV